MEYDWTLMQILSIHILLEVWKWLCVGAVICIRPCARSQLSFSKATNWIIKGAVYTPISRQWQREGGLLDWIRGKLCKTGWYTSNHSKRLMCAEWGHHTLQPAGRKWGRFLNKYCQGCCCTVAHHCQTHNLILFIFSSCSLSHSLSFSLSVSSLFLSLSFSSCFKGLRGMLFTITICVSPSGTPPGDTVKPHTHSSLFLVRFLCS